MTRDDEIRKITDEDEAFVRDALQKRLTPEPSEKVRQIVMQAAREKATKRGKELRRKADRIVMRPMRLRKVFPLGLAAAAILILAVLVRRTPEIRTPEQVRQQSPTRHVVASNGVPKLTELDDRIDSVRVQMENLRSVHSYRSSYSEKETAKLLRRTLRLKARVHEMSS